MLLTSWVFSGCSSTSQILCIYWLKISVGRGDTWAATVLWSSCPAALWSKRLSLGISQRRTHPTKYFWRWVLKEKNKFITFNGIKGIIKYKRGMCRTWNLWVTRRLVSRPNSFIQSRYRQNGSALSWIKKKRQCSRHKCFKGTSQSRQRSGLSAVEET